ncbi:hypothetical protein Salat_1891400 [Sesamum alatum]|uniref:Uncharacterized protein n=1 Tax=Sesamum alatum TaxID=300844 RepID=A0AAE1Y4R1_9LAMI|nr:hypothetical protein Salat_1891400 [Sesamum alatum]
MGRGSPDSIVLGRARTRLREKEQATEDITSLFFLQDYATINLNMLSKASSARGRLKLVEGKELAMTDPSPASVDAPVAFSSVELAISSSPIWILIQIQFQFVVESLLSTPLAFSRVSFKAPQTELHCQSCLNDLRCGVDLQPLAIEARDSPAYCLNIEEEPDGDRGTMTCCSISRLGNISRGNRKGEQFGGYPWGSSVVDKSYLNEVMMEHSSDAGNAHKVPNECG